MSWGLHLPSSDASAVDNQVTRNNNPALMALCHQGFFRDRCFMSNRTLNFSAGPATLPESVLEQAQAAMLDFNGTGIGICEHSHRSSHFVAVYEEAESLCRELAGIPDDYAVLFLQGGASTQFCTVPMNFLTADSTADYANTGSWSQKAIKEAKRFGNVHECCSSEPANFNYIPSDVSYSASPRFVHFTSNNTIFGTQYREEPTPPAGAFLVCDASSDIFSRTIDVTKYGIIYCGAQKNLGPSGTTLVIIRKDLLESANDVPTMLSYKTHVDKQSMFNTPPTFGIFLMGLVFKWLKNNGGLSAIEEQNEAKAGKLYDYLDSSAMFSGTAEQTSRSRMNVTFVTGDADKDAAFVTAATEAGFSGLKGHRSVGGMRASIYNAFPSAGVDSLISFMQDFEAGQ
jgi:phosphoserine aminotransferase